MKIPAVISRVTSSGRQITVFAVIGDAEFSYHFDVDQATQENIEAEIRKDAERISAQKTLEEEQAARAVQLVGLLQDLQGKVIE